MRTASIAGSLHIRGASGAPPRTCADLHVRQEEEGKPAPAAKSSPRPLEKHTAPAVKMHLYQEIPNNQNKTRQERKLGYLEGAGIGFSGTD